MYLCVLYNKIYMYTINNIYLSTCISSTDMNIILTTVCKSTIEKNKTIIYKILSFFIHILRIKK